MSGVRRSRTSGGGHLGRTKTGEFARDSRFVFYWKWAIVWNLGVAKVAVVDIDCGSLSEPPNS
jgi:hypothetical protein